MFTSEIEAIISLQLPLNPVPTINLTAVHTFEAYLRTHMNHLITQIRERTRQLQLEDILFLLRKDPNSLERLTTHLAGKGLRKLTDSIDDDDAQTGEDDIDQQPEIIQWDCSSLFPAISRPYPVSYSSTFTSLDRRKEEAELTAPLSEVDYSRYSALRHSSSFVYRKPKRFREFLNIDGKPSEDVLDALAFITGEVSRQVGRIIASNLSRGIGTREVQEHHVRQAWDEWARRNQRQKTFI